MAAALRTREEIEPQYLWNTSSIYLDDTQWDADFQTVEQVLPQLEALSGSLGTSGAALLDALQQRDTVNALVDRLLVYAFFRRDEDTAHAANQARFDRAAALEARFRTAVAFFTPEILGIDDAALDAFVQEAPGLEQYAFYLSDVRRRREHMRSAEVEAVLAQAAELARAPGTIFDALNDADLVFGTLQDEDGSEIELSHGRFWLLLERRNRDVRRTAFEQHNAAYAAHRTTFAATLNSAIRANIFNARVRNYASALEAALEPDAIPPAVYHNLISTVHDHLPAYQRYIGVRKQILGLDKLYFYDLFLPLSSAPMPPLAYDQARDMVIEALAPLGPVYAGALRNGLNQDRWVDVYETAHKRSGAYSWSAFGTLPFVLLNWQDQFSDLFILAHELGHAMHSYFTNQTQPYVYSSYTIFVAEVASTCNEALLFAHLLRTVTNPDHKRYLLSQQLNNIAFTFFQQTLFAEFEREVHQRTERGEALAAEHFSEIAQQLQNQYFGPDMVNDDAASLFWAVLPHYYMNFYVYKYATGISAGLALARQILQEGQPAVDRYLNFLRSGSSGDSIALLRQAGVDMTTPQPIEQAIELFADLIDQLEAITQAQ